ncbi:hypothetical protein RFF05_06230 [Bengtsoniella intestinalis]
MKKLWTTALMVMALVGVMTVSASAATEVGNAETYETIAAAIV